jgi:hypothetical protein
MERHINGTLVVYRDRFPARFGWDLLAATRRVGKARRARIEELMGRAVADAELNADAPAAEVVAALAQLSWMDLVYEQLSYAEAVRLVRGAVESWGFPGDLARDDCCDGLDTVHEFVPLVTDALVLYYTSQSDEKLQGEAGSGSTSPSEG